MQIVEPRLRHLFGCGIAGWEFETTKNAEVVQVLGGFSLNSIIILQYIAYRKPSSGFGSPQLRLLSRHQQWGFGSSLGLRVLGYGITSLRLEPK